MSTFRRVLVFAMLAVLSGCANTPRLDRQFGQAVNQAKLAQILNPAAPAQQQALTQLDGSAAKSAFDNYQKSFRDPQPTTGALVIGVGR